MRIPVLPRPPLVAVAATLLLAAVLVLVAGDAAYAAADVTKAGKNIGNTLESWAKPLFAGIAGVMAVYFLAARKIGPALGFTGLAMLVGAFVFTPELMSGAAESIAKTTLK